MSCRIFSFVLLFIALATLTGPGQGQCDERVDRVKKAKSLLADSKVYQKGCSGLVSEVLGIPWENAKAIMGPNPKSVGKNGSYKGLEPGDIVGWSDKHPEHVSIYIGEPECKFIDVEKPGMKPRKLASGYGSQEVFKSSKY